jgi:phage terminase small subunit
MPQQETRQTLTPRQRRFVEEYLVDLNGTAAYQRAGYTATPRVARSNAVRLLANASVQAAIMEAQAARAHRVAFTQDAVLREVALLAQSDISHYAIEDQGNVALCEGAPEGAMRAVASLRKKIIHTEETITYDVELRLWNKPAALRMAAEHLGLLTRGVSAPTTIQVVVQYARD